MMKNFLTVFLIVTSVFTGCFKTTKVLSAYEDYIFINDTDKEIKLLIYSVRDNEPASTIVIPKKDTLKFEQIEVDASGKGTLFSVFPFIIFYNYDALKTHVIFGNEKELIYEISNDCDLKSVYCKQYYTTTILSNYSFEYIYTFTEEDYQNATPIVPE